MSSGRHDGTLSTRLVGHLRALERRIPPEEIHELWVFPPLPDLDRSSEFLLFTRYLEGDLRRLCAAEFLEGEEFAANGNGRAERNGNGNGHRNGNGNGNGSGHGNGHANGEGRPLRITEYGRVPSARVDRLVSGFRRRLADEREPLHLPIEGSTESWDRLVSAPSNPAAPEARAAD